MVRVSFTVTDETQAWCDAGGTVVSFTNLRLQQTPNTERAPRLDCGAHDTTFFTGY